MEIKTTFRSGNSKLVFNGQEYGSADEMPEDVRRLYRAAIALAAKGGPNVKVSSITQIVFNGKTYNSVDEMPPDVRVMYNKVMKGMDANQGGGPNGVEDRVRVSIGPYRASFSWFGFATLIILLVWLVVIILQRI